MATEAGDTVYNPNSLIIRGPGADSSIPEGFIRVNDQLQRSQAAPQPLPWWIAQADEEAQARRERDKLQAQINAQQDTSVQAARGIERAMQLEGVLGFDADRKRGIPVQEALMKWAPKMYFKNPSAVARISRDFSRPQPQPFTPTEATVGGQRLIQVSPNRFQITPPERPVREPVLTPTGKLQVLRTQLSEINRQMEAAEGDEEATKALRAQHGTVMDAISELSPIKKTAAPAASPIAKPAVPDKALAREEAKATIKSRPRIAEDVRKLFKQTYGEDL